MLRTALIVGSLLIAGTPLARTELVGNRVQANGMHVYYEASGKGDPLITGEAWDTVAFWRGQYAGSVPSASEQHGRLLHRALELTDAQPTVTIPVG